MEWNRAKNILIVIFLIIDIGLGIVILNQDDKTISVSKNEIEDCRKIFKSNNMVLKAKIPDKIKPLGTIPFRNIVYSDDYINKYKGTGANTFLKNGRFAIFGSYFKTIPYDINKSEKEIIKDVNKVIKYTGVNTAYIKKTYKMRRTEQNVSIQFGQRYKEYNIANSILKVIIDRESAVSTIEYMWYVPEENSNTKQQLVSPLDALIVVMNKIREKSEDRVFVNNVRLGYFIENSDKGAKTIDAIPVWEITASDKDKTKKYYVDAYENKLKEM